MFFTIVVSFLKFKEEPKRVGQKDVSVHMIVIHYCFRENYSDRRIVSIRIECDSNLNVSDTDK